MMIIIPEDVLRIAEALSAPIDELGLSVRSYNGLRRWGITTVADVYRAYEDKQLPRIRNLGEKSVIEIEKHLEEHLAKVAPVNNSEIPNSSDTISRAKAIEAFMDAMNDVGVLDAEDINTVFQKLPPAQPEPSQVAKDIARIVENGKDMRVIEAAQHTPDQNGDIWITVPDIDEVTCVYVQESKSKFCRIFYEER